MFERDGTKLTKRIADMIGDLVGRETTLKALPATSRSLAAAATGTFGATGVRTAVRVDADLACAASLGAALAMIPDGRVKEVIAGGKLDADLADNTHEVFNVMTRALTMDGSIRARLDKFAVLEANAKPAKQDFAWEVSVAGYEAGKLGLTFTFKAPS